MKDGARIRLIVASVLFVSWIGWLSYLAATKTNPVVVSRSQIMNATHLVVAEIQVQENGEPDRQVVVQQVLSHPENADIPLGPLSIDNLKNARLPNSLTFQSSGKYLLTLVKTGPSYELVSPSRSPNGDIADRLRPWVYPWQPSVQSQVEQLIRKNP